MQIDWSFLGAVNWAEVAWFSGIAFLAALVGHVLFKHWWWATILTAVLFAAGYVFLVYYPHERLVPGCQSYRIVLEMRSLSRRLRRLPGNT